MISIHKKDYGAQPGSFEPAIYLRKGKKGGEKTGEEREYTKPHLKLAVSGGFW